jgi:hypothetical protein
MPSKPTNLAPTGDTVHVCDVAQWLGVTEHAVRIMSGKGVYPPINDARMHAGEMLKAVCQRLRKATGRAQDQPAKERLIIAQADLAELKFRKAAKELLDRSAVELVVAGLAIELRRVVQGMDIPHAQKEAITGQLAAVTPESVLARIDADLAEEAEEGEVEDAEE